MELEVEIHTPKIPKRLQIPESLIEDLLMDPVMAAYCIFGARLDAFQAARLRMYWWIPELIDSSGFSSGKTAIFWLYCNLRAVLIGGQVIGVFYQTFGTGKTAFWSQYTDMPWARYPVFQAQLGRLDEEGTEQKKKSRKDASCYTYSFHNGSKILMPAPNWLQDAKGMASMRFNVGGIDEWTKVEATGTKGVNEQFLGRITRSNFNQNHPIWMNHTKFLATAESQQHPGWKRYKNILDRMKAGDPTCGVVSFSYKDFTRALIAASGPTFRGKFRHDKPINTMKKQFDRDHFLREGLGIWSKTGKGWYPEAAIKRSVELGKAMAFEIDRNLEMGNV